MPPSASSAAARRTTLAELGARDGFDVVVVPPFTLDGEEVRSSAIREAIVRGDLADGGAAARPAGDDHRRRSAARSTVARGSTSRCRSPCRPTATTRSTVDGEALTLRLVGGDAYLLGGPSNRRVTVVLGGA